MKMINRIEKSVRIALAPGDRVVSATALQNYVIVVTKRGDVFRVSFDLT